jgi:hypothetical protein
LWKHNQSFRNDFLTLILNTINIILKKDFFKKRIVEQRQRIKSQSMRQLLQLFYSHSKHPLTTSNNSSDEEINKQAASKHHRHSFIPKIMSTFSSNRLVIPTQSTVKSRSSSTERITDAIASLVGNVNKVTGLNEASVKCF